MAKRRISSTPSERDSGSSNTSPKKKHRRSSKRLSAVMRDSLDGETDCTNSSDLCFKSPLTSCHSSDDDGGVTVTESSLSMR